MNYQQQQHEEENIYAVTGNSPDVTSPDVLRQVASNTTSPHKPYRDMTRYTLSVEQVVQRFADAGVPRSPKSIQRYCKDGHLEYVEVDTEKNSKFLINPVSVERRITEVKQAKNVSKSVGDMSQHVATVPEKDVATSPDSSRQQVSEQARETYKQKVSVGISDHEREMYERLLDAKEEQINLLQKSNQALQEDKVILQKMHEREVELLLKTNQETTKSSNLLMNLFHSLWPSAKNGSGKEIPERFVPAVRDVPDTLSGEDEGQRP